MQLLKFTKENFANACSYYWNYPEEVKAKNQFKYFHDYLLRQDCNSILVESNYVSKDFLDNYQFYFASSYKNYNKRCIRLHLFSKNVTASDLQEYILNSKSHLEAFESHYLGFIVIRPIPQKIFGFSLLKTYKNLSKDKFFWGVRPYGVNIFGRKYSFLALAFQEQDGTLSACATTAIWVTLSKANYLNYTLLRTPNQITKDAGITSNSGGRLFPNKGLTISQVCNSIVRSGLDTEVTLAKRIKRQNILNEFNKEEHFKVHDLGRIFDLDNSMHIRPNQIKRVCNAYSQLGIPILCTLQPYKGSVLHAIAINGYKKIEIDDKTIHNINKFHFERIETLYAHDDQWGPYTKIEFDSSKEYGVDTIWTEKKYLDDSSRFISIIVPVYKKVRINFNDVEKIINDLNSIYQLIFKDLTGPIKITYDYFVIDSNEYKSYVNSESTISDIEKLKFVLTSLPKFVWIIRVYINSKIGWDLILDATDVNSNMIGISKITYGNNPKELNHVINRTIFKFRDTIDTHISFNSINKDYVFKLITTNMEYNYITLAENILKENFGDTSLESIVDKRELIIAFLEKKELDEQLTDNEIASCLETFGFIPEIAGQVLPYIPIMWASFSACRYFYDLYKGKKVDEWSNEEKSKFLNFLRNELASLKDVNVEVSDDNLGGLS